MAVDAGVIGIEVVDFCIVRAVANVNFVLRVAAEF